MSGLGTRLRCRTVPLDPSAWDDHPARRHADLVFERDGHGFAGRGVALRVPSALAAEALRGIEVDDTVGGPGTGPVAFGALPFCGSGELVVPAELVGRRPDGTAWVTEVVGAPVPEPPRWGGEPDGFALRSSVPQEDWKAAVAEAVERIAAGRLRKVVLAREVTVEADRAIVLPTVLRRLRSLFPSCTTFLVDGFVGASPELLVRRMGRAVACHPLAGTRPRSGDPEVDARVGRELLASAKDRAEHALVVEAIAGALGPRCEALDVPAAPEVLPLRNVLHLATALHGTLAPPAPDLLSLVGLLHPTPAVGGWPTGEALRTIAGLEPPGGRRRYGGPVCWVDARGDGEAVVGIRAAEVDGARASLWAGVGVVAGSDPDAELAETQFKLQAMLAAIVRP